MKIRRILCHYLLSQGLGFDLGREEPSYFWKAVTFTYETDSGRYLSSQSVTATITITKAASGAWCDILDRS